MNTKCNREQFIEKSKALYGDDAFDYSLVDYVNGYTEITLICKKHGEFRITPTKHLDIVSGCPQCSKEKRRKRGKMSNDEYKQLVIAKHGYKYDLSTVEYKGMRDYVTAICPKHGQFKINAYCFANERGCPKCGIEERSALKVGKKKEYKPRVKLTTEKFIEKSKEVHGDRYNYSKTDLDKRDEKGRVCIVCPVHGEFWQNPYSHLHGHGCEKCGKENMSKTQTYTTETFIAKAKEVHGDKYDYSITSYEGCYNKIDIICPIHGKFSQSPSSHLNGHGCPQCASEYLTSLIVSNTDEFIKKAKQIHRFENNDYSKVVYKSVKIPVTIICEKGHEYLQMPNKHLSGHGCPYCIKNISNPEMEITEFIKSFNLSVETNNRKILTDAKEIDILIPSKNLAIEYDGLHWHNEIKKPDKNFHLNKTKECFENGIRLIHIFEDEWVYKQNIVKSRLKSILGFNSDKIYARKCSIKEVDGKTCREFLDMNHLQGGINSSVRYGLYYNNELVSVMTFGKPRKNLGRNSEENEYELLRFCNKLNTTVIGGASKLFNHFVKECNPTSVISYADRRWNTGQVYENMGFEFTHFSQPNYFYVIGQKRENRFKYRKDVLVREGFDSNKSEHEIMLERGIYRIYDCGCLCYKWLKKRLTIDE